MQDLSDEQHDADAELLQRYASGDAAAAQETFAKVGGDRAPIAKLWAIFAGQQASAGSAG